MIKEHQVLNAYKSEQDLDGTHGDFDESGFLKIQHHAGPNKNTSILDNPVYKKSPFYPFAEDVSRKDADTKRANAVIDDLYKKIKNNYKDKMTEMIVGGPSLT